MTIAELSEIGFKYRGTIIDACANLEKTIESYIALHFCKTLYLARDMIEIVLDRVSFDSKISILETMLKKQGKAAFKKNHSKLFSELRIVKDERNKFAHFIQAVDVSPTRPAKPNVILVSYRNQKQQHSYSEQDFQILFNRIERCIEEISKLPGNKWISEESGSPYKP